MFQRTGAAIGAEVVIGALMIACQASPNVLVSAGGGGVLVSVPNPDAGPGATKLVPQTSGGSETAAAIVPMSSSAGGDVNLVIAYNQSPAALGTGVVAWSVSSDSPHHTSFTKHFENRLEPSLGVDDRFGRLNPKPLVLGDGHAYSRGASDPGLVWTGWPRQVALVYLALSTGSGSNLGSVDIVMAVSNDGGNSFDRRISFSMR